MRLWKKSTTMYAVISALIFLFLNENTWSKTYYVSTTGNDANKGSIDLPLRTVKQGVKIMMPGDTLYLRAGRYKEYNIELKGKRGSVEKKFYLASYPGEWAIIDGGHPGNCNIFTATTSWGTAACYWKFERIEVTGAGYDAAAVDYNIDYSGKGFGLWTAHHMEFYKCYIHHNYGCAGPNGGAGISVNDKDGHGAQNITIKYCVFEENGWLGSANENTQNIVLYGDYHDAPEDIPDLTYPMQGNEIAYNLIIGSAIGIKTKSCQRIVLDNNGNLSSSMEGKILGDKIHHNIIKGPLLYGIVYEQDFKQVYNNIVDLRGSNSVGIVSDPLYYRDDRETFYSVIYNNTIISDAAYSYERSAIKFQHGVPYNSKSNYDQMTEGYHPYIYCYNNLIYHVSKDIDFNIHVNTSYGLSSVPISIFKWNTIHISNNFFGDRDLNAKAFSMGKFINSTGIEDSSKGYVVSANKFKTYSSENTNYARVTNNLFLDKELYRTNPACSVSGTMTIENGGYGRVHPYLLNQNIPSYIGATDPKDNKWVDTVQNLKAIIGLKKETTKVGNSNINKKEKIRLSRNTQVKISSKGMFSLNLKKNEFGHLSIAIYNLNGSQLMKMEKNVADGTQKINIQMSNQKSNGKIVLCKLKAF